MAVLAKILLTISIKIDMRTSHALLLRLRHDSRFEFSKVRVEFINRGAPGDKSEVHGDSIIELGGFGMEIVSKEGSTLIPYHRIRQITHNGSMIWKKE